MYDQAVFMSESGKVSSNLQQLIEEPELYLVALSSSSPADQLGIIPAGLDDLPELAEGLCTSAASQ